MEKPAEIKNDLLTYGYYIVAFMDLLGQREAMRKFTGLPDKNNKEQMDNFIAYMKDTVGAIDQFHKMFQYYFDQYTKAGNSSPYKLLMFSNSIRFQRYTDGIMIFMSLHEPEGRAPIDGVFGVLAACASIFLLFLSIGKPMRGGIEIDTGVELNENELLGPAVVESYELESEIAQYPRIVVGKELFNYLRLHSKNETRTPFSKLDSEIAKTCLGLLTADSDGYVIIDYLGKWFRTAIAQELTNEVPFQAYRFVQQQAEKWCNEEKNEKLCERYKRLNRYFDERIPIWQ